jgi:hypothetical protein
MGGILTKTSNKGFSEKYLKLRENIENGDLILYKGTSFLSKSIQYFDKAYYNHIGVVWRPEDTSRVLTLDMWEQGLTCLPLSRRMEGYSDFCILRPKVSSQQISRAINASLQEWDGRDIKYDTMLLPRVALIKKTGFDLSGLGKKGKFICSEFAQYYCELLGLNTYDFLNLITPEDFRRFMDDNFMLLHDEAPAPDMSYYEKNKEVKCLFGHNYKLKSR